MVRFIDAYKYQYRIESICRVLLIAPSTYYRAKDLEDCPKKRSLRSQHDDFYISEIRRIWQDSKCRYDARKLWQQMRADGIHIARCTVERLMSSMVYKASDAAKVRLPPPAVTTKSALTTWSIATLMPIVLISCGLQILLISRH